MLKNVLLAALVLGSVSAFAVDEAAPADAAPAADATVPSDAPQAEQAQEPAPAADAAK